MIAAKKEEDTKAEKLRQDKKFLLSSKGAGKEAIRTLSHFDVTFADAKTQLQSLKACGANVHDLAVRMETLVIGAIDKYSDATGTVRKLKHGDGKS